MLHTLSHYYRRREAQRPALSLPLPDEPRQHPEAATRVLMVQTLLMLLCFCLMALAVAAAGYLFA